MSKKILVLNGDYYADAILGLGEITTRVGSFLDKPEDFSLVLFTGGADVDPVFYGDTSPDYFCSSNPRRDIQEKMVFEHALQNHILMAGICRGLQFFNVMAGGKMMHHINHHEGCIHFVETASGENFFANSLHHQMIIPAEGALVTAWTRKNHATVYYGDKDLPVNYKGKDIEAAIFPDSGSFGVQYHPEAMSPTEDGFKYFYNMVSNALSMDWLDFIKLYTTKDAENTGNGILHEVPESAFGIARRSGFIKT